MDYPKGISEFKSNLIVKTAYLNTDKVPEYIVNANDSASGIDCFADAMRSRVYIYEKNGGKFILIGQSMGRLTPLKSKTNGYRDLKGKVSFGASTDSYFMRFNSKTYK